MLTKHVIQRSVFVILASGTGSRAGGDVPKQYQRVGGRPVLDYSLKTAFNHPEIEIIILVINPQDKAFWQPIIDEYKDTPKIKIVYGGAERSLSVLNALEALEALNTPANATVIIHDAARPFISPALVSRAIIAAKHHGAAIPVLPVPDTIKLVDEAGYVVSTPPRKHLRIVQTPQAFQFELLHASYKAAEQTGRWNFTDDASIVESNNISVHCFKGEDSAFKITTMQDFLRAEMYIGDHAMLDRLKLCMRVATGYDVHAFGVGDHIWLGGFKIPFEKSLIGHSDADPVLHALTDAVLGTLAEGDIGSHFPPSDPQWKDVESHIFLKYAVDLLTAQNGRLVHLDATIVCEFPKIGPYREAMRQKIADICNISIHRVSVKATTSEKLGFTGRGEGIAAMATATVELPDSIHM